MMKVIIAGSRGINDYILVQQAIIDSGLWSKYTHKLEIVSGTCKNSPDVLGEAFASNNKLTLHRFPANWDKYGRRAGFVRNVQMGEFSDALIAIWDGKSKGTQQMVEWSWTNGLYTFVANQLTGENSVHNEHRS